MGSICLDEKRLQELPLGELEENHLRCPHCHATDETTGFRYLEDIQNWRRFEAVKGKQLVIDGRYETGEGYDDGDNGRLMCDGCTGEFRIPEGFELEFV